MLYYIYLYWTIPYYVLVKDCWGPKLLSSELWPSDRCPDEDHEESVEVRHMGRRRGLGLGLASRVEGSGFRV